MLRNLLSAAVVIISLSACAIPHKQLDSNPAFSSHQYSSADMDISWKTERLDNAFRIDGTVTNVRTNYVYDNLELEAALLDRQGKVIAKDTYIFSPARLKGSESFKMNIPLEKDMQPERIKFHYRYGIDEDRFSVKFVSEL